MNRNKRVILEIVFLSVAVLLVVFFMFRDKINVSPGTSQVSGNVEMMEANSVTDEITKDISVFQKFRNTNNSIGKIAVVFTRLYDLGNVKIAMELLDGNKTLIKKTISVDEIEDQHRTYLEAESPITGMAGKELTLRIYPVTDSDTGLALMYNNSTSSTFQFGTKKVNGTICFSVTSE